MTATATVIHGDCLGEMRRLAAEGVRVQAIVTDPPSGIGFMNREWDRDRGGRDHWITWMRERAAVALTLVPPGGHALVWALPRTSHWTATAWEDAGWEVRERLAYIFGTGFPKGQCVSKALDRMAGAKREVVGPKTFADGSTARRTQRLGGNATFCDPVSRESNLHITAPATEAAKQWAGWGTALKPAVEDWWLFRRPLAGMTVAECVLANGVGALNIDATRIPAGDKEPTKKSFNADARHEGYQRPWMDGRPLQVAHDGLGRWPANLLHSGDAEVEAAFAVFGERPSGSGNKAPRKHDDNAVFGNGLGWTSNPQTGGDTGSASRFFAKCPPTEDELRLHYCAKAGKADRAGSKHPCIKPQSLLRWLARLCCPPGGTILDPFAGSGSMATAAMSEGFNAILIEQNAEYVSDIHARLAAFQAEREATEQPAVPPLLAAMMG